MASEERRQTILAAAEKLLLKQGYRATSMEAIARAAAVAKPTLYAYFPDKAAIFLAIVEQLIASWHLNFVLALFGDGDIVQRVGAALTANHKAVMQTLAGSPHAAELYGAQQQLAAAQFHAYDSETAATLEAYLLRAGVARARALVAHGKGDRKAASTDALQRLAQEGRKRGLLYALAAIDDALRR